MRAIVSPANYGYIEIYGNIFQKDFFYNKCKSVKHPYGKAVSKNKVRKYYIKLKLF